MSRMVLASMFPRSSATESPDRRDQEEICLVFNTRDSPTLERRVCVRAVMVTLYHSCPTLTEQRGVLGGVGLGAEVYHPGEDVVNS